MPILSTLLNPVTLTGPILGSILSRTASGTGPSAPTTTRSVPPPTTQPSTMPYGSSGLGGAIQRATGAIARIFFPEQTSPAPTTQPSTAPSGLGGAVQRAAGAVARIFSPAAQAGTVSAAQAPGTGVRSTIGAVAPLSATTPMPQTRAPLTPLPTIVPPTGTFTRPPTTSPATPVQRTGTPEGTFVQLPEDVVRRMAGVSGMMAPQLPAYSGVRQLPEDQVRAAMSGPSGSTRQSGPIIYDPPAPAPSPPSVRESMEQYLARRLGPSTPYIRSVTMNPGATGTSGTSASSGTGQTTGGSQAAGEQRPAMDSRITTALLEMLTKGYEAPRRELERFGESYREQLRKEFRQDAARQEQEAAARGLGNSTIRAALLGAARQRRNDALLELEDRLAAARAGLLERQMPSTLQAAQLIAQATGTGTNTDIASILRALGLG